MLLQAITNFPSDVPLPQAVTNFNRAKSDDGKGSNNGADKADPECPPTPGRSGPPTTSPGARSAATSSASVLTSATGPDKSDNSGWSDATASNASSFAPTSPVLAERKLLRGRQVAASGGPADDEQEEEGLPRHSAAPAGAAQEALASYPLAPLEDMLLEEHAGMAVASDNLEMLLRYFKATLIMIRLLFIIVILSMFLFIYLFFGVCAPRRRCFCFATRTMIVSGN